MTDRSMTASEDVLFTIRDLLCPSGSNLPNVPFEPSQAKKLFSSAAEHVRRCITCMIAGANLTSARITAQELGVWGKIHESWYVAAREDYMAQR